MTSRRRWRVCASSRRSYQRFTQAISPSERSSSHVPPTAIDEAPEASSEEEPSKEDSPVAAEESAPAPVRVTHRAVVLTSGLRPVGPVSGPGKLFGKGLPGSEDLLNLMVL